MKIARSAILTAECGLMGLRPHDLRHNVTTMLAESSESSEHIIMSIVGHLSNETRRCSRQHHKFRHDLEYWKRKADDERRRKQLNSKDLNGRDGQI